MKFKILLVSMVLLFSLMNSAFANGFMAVANVSKIHGSVFINKEKIKVGAEIASGMELRIPKKGDFVDVKFQNGHIVRFVGAIVKIEDITPKSTLFNLIKGKIFSAIRPLTVGETFLVKTKNASFGVRGTKFYIDESKKNSYLCVCEGIVATKTAKGEVEVKKDEDLTLTSAKADLLVNPATQNMIDMGNTIFKDMGVY